MMQLMLLLPIFLKNSYFYRLRTSLCSQPPKSNTSTLCCWEEPLLLCWKAEEGYLKTSCQVLSFSCVKKDKKIKRK